MFCSTLPSQSFSKVVRFLAASALALVLGGLASCSGGSNASNNDSVSQPTLTLSPSGFRLTAGAAGQQASLLLGAPGGSAVTVSVSGLPSGVTVSPATLSVTPGVALPLTMTASSSTPTTTATLVFTTSVGGKIASTQASLSVTGVAPADFSLSVLPTSVTLTANGTASMVSVLAAASEWVFFQRSSSDHRPACRGDGAAVVAYTHAGHCLHTYAHGAYGNGGWIVDGHPDGNLGHVDARSFPAHHRNCPTAGTSRFFAGGQPSVSEPDYGRGGANRAVDGNCA